MFTAEIESLVRMQAKAFDIPYALLAAQVEHESGGNPLAVRYESTYRWTWPPPADPIGARYVKPIDPRVCNGTTEEFLQKCSFGLMQVMGAVARELGFRGPSLLALAADANLGLIFGVRWMRRKMDKYPSIDEALSAYNAGHRTTANVSCYVYPILKRMTELEQDGRGEARA